MELIFFVLVGYGILYIVITKAVEEGVYSAMKRIEKEKESPEETMIQIGERVQKECEENKKE